MFFSIVPEKTTLDDEEEYVNVDESIVRLYDVNMETGEINLIHESDSSFGAHISQGMLYDH